MFRSPATHFLVSTASHRQSSTRLGLSVLCGVSLASSVFSAPSQAVTQVKDGSATTYLPGGKLVAKGLRTAVVSATVTEGDAANAQRALIALNTAIRRTRDFAPIPTAQVAQALNDLTTRGGTDLRLPEERRRLTSPATPIGEPEATDTRSPLDAQDFRALGKKLKADRMMTVYITPGQSSDASATFGAVVEMYETKTGALVGRGEGSFTATLETAATAEAATTSETATTAATSTTAAPSTTAATSTALRLASDTPVVDGVARATVSEPLDLPVRALGGAVFRAVQELNRPISLRGIVLNIPEPYKARVSLSELKGLRNGARIEFLDGENPVAYGTVSSVGSGEALVSVAPEAAFPLIYVNMRVRNVNNPTVVRAGRTDDQLDEIEFRRFETEFGANLLVAGLITLAAR